MKKILSFAMAAMLSLPMFGQIVRSTTFNPEKQKTTWYARIGLSANNLTGDALSEFKNEADPEDGEKYGFRPTVGYDIDFGFRKNFGKTNLYWGMEVGLGTRGGKFFYDEEDGDDWEKESCKINAYTFKFSPFTIGYMYSINDKIRVDGHFGIYASVDMAGSYSEHFESSYDYDDGDGNGGSWGYNEYCTMNRFDAGIQLGIGVWYGHFNLNFTWQRGFATFTDEFPWGDSIEGDKGYQTSNAIISLGYEF